jgi:hypothetical protein
MLREVSAKQIPGDYGRRLFVDDYFDLYIWFDTDHLLYGFQLCYDKDGYERSLTWRRDKGFTHAAVDSGEAIKRGGWARGQKMSPILIDGNPFQPEKIQSLFFERSEVLPEELRQFIGEKIGDSATLLYDK